MGQAEVVPRAMDVAVERLKGILQERPLYLNIETTNICNARCGFCAYPKMKRPKAVMADEVFEKTVHDYLEMGGGAVSLTPIVGDVLLDPHLVDRLRILRASDGITNISLTTNGIAWGRYSSLDRRYILESLDAISFSVGGLDGPSYLTMFGVERFGAVRAAIDSVCNIKSRHDLPAEIHLMFRVNRPIDELLSDPEMDQFRRCEINGISVINRFGNWGGVIQAEDLPPGAQMIGSSPPGDDSEDARSNPCFVYFMSPEVTVSGVVTACGCMNAEARELILGDIREQHLREIWTGELFRRLKGSFGTGDLPDICSKCTFYADGERFISDPALRNFQVGDNPWQVIRSQAVPPGAALADVLASLVDRGCKRIALYGAGNYTRTALSTDGGNLRVYPIVAVIDDDPQLAGTHLGTLAVVSRDDALALGLDAVVLATDHCASQMWDASRELRDAGIHVATIERRGD